MKKQFFYAAFAIAMMASCTNDDVNVSPVEPTPEDSRVAIELGIDAPTVNAKIDSRASGSVGDVESAKNHWNSQKLYIAMYEKGTNNLAEDATKEGEDKSIISPTTHTFIAPKAPADEEDVTNEGGIRIYQTYNAESDNGILKYEYYPVAGQYDFVGYHVDDLTVSFDDETKTVSDIIITGKEDIMGAVTKELVKTKDNGEGQAPTDLYPNLNTEEFNDLKDNWAYSARTARNGIKPTLKFEHQLARLKFFVRAGSDNTAAKVENAGSWEDRNIVVTDDAGNQLTEAMYVTSLTAKNLVNSIVMNLGATDENGKTIVTTTAAEGATETNTFTLGQYDATTKQIIDLKPVAPLYPISLKEAEEDDNFQGEPVYKETQIGESIMFLPTGTSEKEVTVALNLQQYVKLTEDESIYVGALKPGKDPESTNSEDFYTQEEVNELKYTWGYKNQTADVTIYAKSVKNAANGTVDKFEPGKSYNVYITIYGFQKIEISAELTAWEMGGDIEVDIEDKVSKHDVTYTFAVQDSDGTPIDAATVKFNGSDQADDDKAITVKNGTKFTYTIEADGYVTKTETITAGAYDTTTTITLYTQEELDAAQNNQGGAAEGTE